MCLAKICRECFLNDSCSTLFISVVFVKTGAFRSLQTHHFCNGIYIVSMYIYVYTRNACTFLTTNCFETFFSTACKNHSSLAFVHMHQMLFLYWLEHACLTWLWWGKATRQTERFRWNTIITKAAWFGVWIVLHTHHDSFSDIAIKGRLGSKESKGKLSLIITPSSN